MKDIKNHITWGAIGDEMFDEALDLAKKLYF